MYLVRHMRGTASELGLSVTTEIQMFGGKLLSGIFCNSNNAFFDIM